MTKDHQDVELQIEQWMHEAKQGGMSWTVLAERILALQHSASRPDQPDQDRARRCGFGEVIFGSGKSAPTCVSIAQKLMEVPGQEEVLLTRMDHDNAAQVAREFPFSRYAQQGRTLRVSKQQILEVRSVPCPAPQRLTPTFIVTAGSTDAPVADEALETLRWMGVAAELITDIGVAGPYRLLAHLEALQQANCVVVVAGMEGALSSVVGGLVPCPVIAVPTSVGYGTNFEGITTLLSMMSSCAAGVTAVNIDAGFKGGYVAGLIAHRIANAS